MQGTCTAGWIIPYIQFRVQLAQLTKSVWYNCDLYSFKYSYKWLRAVLWFDSFVKMYYVIMNFCIYIYSISTFTNNNINRMALQPIESQACKRTCDQHVDYLSRCWLYRPNYRIKTATQFPRETGFAPNPYTVENASSIGVRTSGASHNISSKYSTLNRLTRRREQQRSPSFFLVIMTF